MQLTPSCDQRYRPKYSRDRAYRCRKTEIARRLAKLAGAPFVKVEQLNSPRLDTLEET